MWKKWEKIHLLPGRMCIYRASELALFKIGFPRTTSLKKTTKVRFSELQSTMKNEECFILASFQTNVRMLFCWNLFFSSYFSASPFLSVSFSLKLNRGRFERCEVIWCYKCHNFKFSAGWNFILAWTSYYIYWGMQELQSDEQMPKDLYFY